ncbi:hypothetical protein KAI04_04125 [Candidatus Pacearchaeota archaeon]|nr:hypothetical protein [Candidatus Pacearchaeota archaeon]
MKCKHKWQPVNVNREEEYNFPKEEWIGDKNNFIIFKDWIVGLVCLKCKKIKWIKVKELK